MIRHVEPELLDALPPDDPRAIRSRLDLCRVNAWMGNPGIMARALHQAFPRHPPRRIVEIGAGDGEFMLHVAHRCRRHWRDVDATLVDRQQPLKAQVRARLSEMGWRVESANTDVFDWLQQAAPQSADAIVANLFLHHFTGDELRGLFNAITRITPVMIAVEPRRSGLSLVFSRLLWMIGCNAVTRHDAVISVRAGFAERELSTQWPDGVGWSLAELPAGLFSHLFVARRRSG